MNTIERGWRLVDLQYEQPERYPTYETLHAVDTALDRLAAQRETVRYWHVSAHVDTDDAAVTAALDLFASLDLLASYEPADPRTTTAYRVASRDRLTVLDEAYGYAETPYLLSARD